MKASLLFLLFLMSSLIKLSAQDFIQNLGQVTDQNGNNVPSVLYVGQTTKGFHIQLRKTGYSYEWFRTASQSFFSPEKFNCKHSKLPESSPQKINRLDLEFLNANPNCKIESSDYSSTNNYYLKSELISAPAFKRVVYKNLYDKIDVEFIVSNGSQQSFKYNVIVHPNADLSKFKMQVKGAKASVKNNQLLFNADDWQVTENIPVSFYLSNQKTINEIQFDVSDNIIGFTGEFDPTQTLVIDPISNLVWGTYQGGNNTDVCLSLGHDSNDNLYITGYTNSASNIASTGVYQATLAGSLDIFLSKFNKNGQRIWTTYFGGPDVDIAYAMQVQADGTCYLAGATNSTLNVATSGAHQTTYGGGINDILIASFNSNGFRNWSTYYGGGGHDIAQAITCDKFGNVIFTGHTESTSNIASSGAYKTIYNFNYDVCLVKFTANGQRIWGTYYGDSGIDEAYAVTTDPQNNIYISGGTTSISDISTPSSHQLNTGGANDAFIAKFDTSGATLVWGTYMGGVANDAGTAMEVSNGTLFVGGNTSSTNNIASAGAQQPAPLSFDETFLSAFSFSGTRLWSTYFGGDDTEYINDMVIDGKSQILICGATTSTSNISTTGAYQTTLSSVGNYDSFFARYTANGSRQLSTYYGGENNDQASGITLDGTGKVYLAGQTTSTLQIASTGAFQTTFGGGTDAFLAKFCIPFQAPISPAKSATYCPGSVTLSTAAGYSNYLWSNGLKINPMVVNIFTLGKYKFSVQVNDGPECTGTSDTTFITIMSCLGISDSGLEGSTVEVYPNPSHDQVTLRFSSAWHSSRSIEVYDCQGKLLLNQTTNNLSTHVMNTSDLDVGLYFLRVKEGDQTYFTRFIKQ